MTLTIIAPTAYIVILENYDGRCNRVRVLAHSPEDAMAMTQRGGWVPVDVKAA
jgi:hypothetical protein